jgi:hypothetical protein
VPLLEEGFEVEADRRQADEAEHERRAQAAFEAVERVVLEGPEEVRQAAVEKGRDERRAARQDVHGRQVRLLDHLGEDLGEEAGVGQRDGEEAGGGAEAEDLDEKERPEQLVDGAEGRREHADGAKGRIGDGEDEAASRAEADSDDGEGHRPDHAPGFDGEEVGAQDAAPEPRQFGPGVEGRDRDVGEERQASAARRKRRLVLP